MKRFTIIILSLTILTILFVAGCLNITETEVKPSEEQGIINYKQQETESTEDETVNEISKDISDVNTMDDDLDIGDIDNLTHDLNDLDW